MSVRERALLFSCHGEELVAVLTQPEVPLKAGSLGVLVVVGGPQYRVGSHRQFVLLARQLARAGMPCLRFDYRGMGDASGAMRDFAGVDEDIRAAIDVFFAQEPQLGGVVLWGLCDGASAALLYAPQDARVRGLVLLNPWVRTEAGAAAVMLRHYYLQRLLSAAFWKKLLTGGVALGRSWREVGQQVSTLQGGSGPAPQAPAEALPQRLRQAWQRLDIPWRVVLSGQDFVAREFAECVAAPAWAALDVMRQVTHLEAADHTFSTAQWRAEVAALTAAWVHEWQNEQD